MRILTKSFRMVGLLIALLLTLSAVGLASARTTPTMPTLQATADVTATPIDPNAVVKLTIGTEFTSPLDKDVVINRILSFKGQANHRMTVTIKLLTGNMSVKAYVNTQTDTEIGYAEGIFVDTMSLTLKLPQDGNYTIKVVPGDPGAGDFAAGTFSVVVNDALAITAATMAATKLVTK